MVKKLIAGFSDFKKNFFGPDRSFFERLAKRGQKPKTIIILPHIGSSIPIKTPKIIYLEKAKIMPNSFMNSFQ